MKLVNFVVPNDQPRRIRVGAVVGRAVIDLHAAESWAQGARGLPPALPDFADSPEPMLPFIASGSLEPAREVLRAIAGGDPLHLKSAHRQRVAHPLDSVRLISPMPLPTSLRDFYAFEQHVKAARANRGAEMIPDWYDIPVFYFSNHTAILGPDDPVRRPKASQALDFELEVACVIGQRGKDIPAAEAQRYIFGYMVMNDWSARDVQLKEMKVGLGPAKGKDFATSLGPVVVTPDELDATRATMVARVNGEERSRGELGDMYFSWERIVEHAARNTRLLPGDVLGSGTVGTGCILELGDGRWLHPGDIVELEVEGIGVLRNTVGPGG